MSVHPIPGPRRAGAAFVACLGIAALVSAPAALAQVDEPEQPEVSDPESWSSSAFAEPFAAGPAMVRTETFEITGLFTKDRRALEEITSVTVEFADVEDEFTLPEEESCLPAPVVFADGGSTTNDTASYPFTVLEENSTWPCNGRFEIAAAAQSSRETVPYRMSVEVTVAVRPAPVADVDVRFAAKETASTTTTTTPVTTVPAQQQARAETDTPASERRTVVVSWTELGDEERSLDAAGYRIERAGPLDADGNAGAYTVIGEVAEGDDPEFGDALPEPGTYRYRVRSLRAGADGPIASDIDGTGTADVTRVAPPGSPTTTSVAPPNTASDAPAINRRPLPTIPSASGPGVTIPTTPTTLDTGFDETLSYGDRLAIPELVGENGSVIVNEDDSGGVGLLGPAAGAFVLAGWAGHVFYVNRLAKQF